MPVDTETQPLESISIRAPRGTSLSCKGWQQEAAMRMLMNNLDPDVAERPQDLVVYGGTGKAARNWPCYHAIINALKNLGNDETLLVQSASRSAYSERMSTLPASSSPTRTSSAIGRTGRSSTNWSAPG